MADTTREPTSGAAKERTDGAVSRWASIWLVPLGSVDLIVGVLAGLGSGLAANQWPEIKDHVIGLGFGSMALGVAILGVSLTALAILVGLLDENYLKILRRVPGGVPGVLAQYRIVALVSGLTVCSSVILVLIWEVVAARTRSLFLGITVGFVAWSVAGAVQLVNFTAFHGEERASLLGGIQSARRAVEKQRRDSA